MRTGNGTMKYINGERYEGEWGHNKKTGFGIFYYLNGNKYSNNFLIE